jgi:hypothetical protein
MTPEQALEAERASLLFHAALVAQGAQAVTDTLSLYDDVPPLVNVNSTQAVTKWLTTAVRYVMSRRLRARDMALAYYRYQRALTTGTTIALPGQDNPPYTTLPELKRQFESRLNPPDEPEPAPADGTDAQEADVPEADRISVEVLEGLEDELDALEDEAAEQVRDNLIVLGPLNQDRKTRNARNVETPEQADAARDEAHQQAAKRQSAAAERNVLNGARGPLFLAANRDKRALGYVRASRTGTPCGFCAMLISRGFVYKSAKTAGDQDLWHDNCHCYAIPVFSLRQYESEKLFALNREYQTLWNTHIKDKYSGDEALTEWRRLIRERAKSQKSQEAAA